MPDARGLGAAERGAQVAQEPAVDPAQPDLDRAGHAERGAEVLRAGERPHPRPGLPSDEPLPQHAAARPTQQVIQPFAREGASLQLAHEMVDALTAIALAAGGRGAFITTGSRESLRLPSVVYRRLE